jgi:hypothetical protein
MEALPKEYIPGFEPRSEYLSIDRCLSADPRTAGYRLSHEVAHA